MSDGYEFVCLFVLLMVCGMFVFGVCMGCCYLCDDVVVVVGDIDVDWLYGWCVVWIVWMLCVFVLVVVVWNCVGCCWWWYGVDCWGSGGGYVVCDIVVFL